MRQRFSGKVLRKGRVDLLEKKPTLQPMATPVINEIENEFARLPAEAQLCLLERLIHQTRMSVTGQREDWGDALSAMAADPEIQRELSQIDAEFRATESDRLGID